MPKTIIRIKTWRCPSCDYTQDFDPTDAALMRLHFPNVAVGDCPACSMGRNPTHVPAKVAMAQETRAEKLAVMTVMGVEDIEEEIAQTTPALRFQRREDERAKRGRSPLTLAEQAATGTTETNAYRADRLLDIAHAIGEARKREYVP